MPLDLARRRRTARRRLMLIGTGALGVVVVAAIVVLGFADQPPSNGKAPGTAATTAPADGSPSRVDGLTVLPKPREIREGVPVGFPHTLNGAISAAAHFYDVYDAFDPAVAEKQSRITAEPGKEDKIGDDAYRFAMVARTSAGLTAVGESDSGNYYKLQSRAFRVASVKPTRVTVWILTDAELSVRGVLDSKVTVQTAYLVWQGGDWRFTGQEPRHEPKPLVPGSAEAHEKGWRDLAYQN